MPKRVLPGRTKTVVQLEHPYSVDAEKDYLLLVDTSGGNITIELPPAADAKYLDYFIKKITADGNSVTVDPDGGETIDGAGTVVTVVQYYTFRIYSDGTQWWII
jgi:hypothetical protein